MEGGLSGDNPRENPEKLNPREGKETLEDIDRGVSETIREIAGPEEAREMEAEAEKLEDYDEEKRIDEGINKAIRDTVGEDEADETQEELEEADDSDIDEGVGQAIRDTLGDEEASERDEEGERLDEEVTDEKIEEVIEETLEERDQEKVGQEVEQIIEEVEKEAADGSNEGVGEEDEGREHGEDIGDDEIEEPPGPELDPLEEKVLESFEEHGIDKEEVRERMEERFRKDVENLLEEEKDFGEETRVQEGEGTEERTAAGQGAHIETGDGTVQVMVMPSDEGTDGKATQEAKTVEESEETAEASEEKEDLAETQSVEKEVKEEAADTQAAEVDEEIEPEKAREGQGEGIRKEEATDSKSEGEISESVEGEKLEQYAQEGAEEQREGSERKEEGEGQDEGEEAAEIERRESLYVPRRKISLAGNEGLVNPTERQLENPYADPEEEHRKWLREMYRAFPEGLRKRLREIGKKRPVDKEDYEKLLKRYGPELEDIPGIEEMKEEGYEYYRFKEALKQLEEDDVDIEEVADRAGIPVEQAREYANGKVAPIVTALQNYETEYQTDKMLRQWLMLGSGKDVHEIVEMVREHPDIAEDSLSEQEMEELQVWIEIIEAKEREDIEFCVRVGREVFRKDQVVELAKAHGLEVEVVLSWLWELDRPEGALKLEQRLYAISEQDERTGRVVLEEGCPTNYFLSGFPRNLGELEWMMRRHPQVAEKDTFPEAHRETVVYFKIRERQERGELDGITAHELAKEYDESVRFVRRTLKGRPRLRLVEWLIKNEMERREYENEKLPPEAFQYRIKPLIVYRTFEELRGRRGIPTEEIAECIVQLYRTVGEPKGVRFADFRIPDRPWGRWTRKLFRLMRPMQEELEAEVNKQLGLDDDPTRELRVGLKDYKLYFRMHDKRWRNWFNLYKNELFYFESVEDKATLVKETMARLGVKGPTHYSKLIKQVTDYTRTATGSDPNSDLNLKLVHLRGESLHFMLDVMGLKIQDIEGKIHHIGRTREGKSGTIVHPKFPSGPEMVDIILAIIVGAAMSDGHLHRENTGFVYTEKHLSRIEILLEHMSTLGEINHNMVLKDNGVYRIRFPSVIGRMLERLGVPVGDSCIQKKGLPRFVLKGSLMVKCVYLSQLWTEDGCFSIYWRYPFPVFSWSRTSVLYDESKGHMYDVRDKIQANILYLFSEYGHKKESATPGRKPDIVIYAQNLENLREHEDAAIADAAQKIWILANLEKPNLMLDEIRLLADLGVNTAPQLKRFVLYEESGRISVEWTSYINNQDDITRVALLAPPDDVRKKERVEEEIESDRIRKRKILKQIDNEGLKWIVDKQRGDDRNG